MPRIDNADLMNAKIQITGEPRETHTRKCLEAGFCLPPSVIRMKQESDLLTHFILMSRLLPVSLQELVGLCLQPAPANPRE